MKHELYPELEQLFTCYLHEDIHYDYPTQDAALRGGIVGLPPDSLLAACEEMERLRGDSRDTKTLTQVVRKELGAHYLWEVDGYTLDEWLAHVARMLNQRKRELESGGRDVFARLFPDGKAQSAEEGDRVRRRPVTPEKKNRSS
jgi:hypothetical protein